MPPRRYLSNSTSRRHKRADRILCSGVLTIRPCASCVSHGTLCVLSSIDERCEQCYRSQRSCELASPWPEFDRLYKEKEKIRQQRLEAELKAVRLRKQERALQKRLKALGDREEQNILDLEMNEATAEALEPPADGQPQVALSPTGLSQVSFGSFGRTSPLPTGSS
jgi:hypothetical protein